MDERRELDGEMYARRCLAKARSISSGGVGERERIETSESDMSEEGTELSGELAWLVRIELSIVEVQTQVRRQPGYR